MCWQKYQTQPVSSCYNNCQAVVDTPKWRSEPFHFKRGVFQGDPVSPVIFLMAFNPVLLHLKLQQETIGYKLNNNASIVTLPYADDFCLITTHKNTHQRTIDTINSHINSMGMKLKPSKCRSFTISAGSPKDVPFYIGDHRVPSIKDEEQKFLGKPYYLTRVL